MNTKMINYIDLYRIRTPFTPTDEAALTAHGFMDTGISVTDSEGNEFMNSVKNGDTIQLKGSKEYEVKIKNLERQNAHKINFTIELIRSA
jgi:hypothetical protein